MIVLLVAAVLIVVAGLSAELARMGFRRAMSAPLPLEREMAVAPRVAGD